MRRIDMDNVVHLISLEIENFKNVEYGKINFPNTYNYKKGNVLGIYGQNASGKTAVVKAIALLQSIIALESLPEKVTDIVTLGADFCRIKVQLLLKLDNKFYNTNYEVQILNENSCLFISKENVTYKRNLTMEKESEFKSDISKAPTFSLSCNLMDENELFNYSSSVAKSTNFDILSLTEKKRARLQIRNESSLAEKKSFLFLEEVASAAPAEMFNILSQIRWKFIGNTFVIGAEDMAQVYRNLFLPINFYIENKDNTGATGGLLGFDMGNIDTNDVSDFMLLSKSEFYLAKKLFEQINEIMPTLIPNLKLELEEQGRQTLKNGDTGIRTGLVSIRGKNKLPFSYESEGVKKLASMISLFSAMYNNPNMLVVIDELDAGIYEYLLGEILEVLNNGGMGQLLFTSHNLRLLEVLKQDNFVFSTTNEQNRFINFKDIKKSNNLRTMYLREIVFGGGEESIYAETDSFFIRKAFEAAGRIHHE